MNKLNKNNGFTLIELSMVLFILALLLGSFLTPLATSLEQRDRALTTDMLEDIRESLIGYALVNGHFPCPDCTAAGGNCTGGAVINDGIEDGVSGGAGVSPRVASNFDSCAVLVGNLPWTTLDVPENDAWGTHYIYRVTDDYADDVDGTDVGSCPNPAAGISFCLNSAIDDGDIDIDDENGVIIAEDVPVIVVSIGKNSDVAFANLSAAEQENQDGDTDFVAADYIQTDGSEFDDLVIWIPPSILMYEMVRAERLP
jgi:prepilin-type N-terminal cleavage/methylation domain-containing protein